MPEATFSTSSKVEAQVELALGRRPEWMRATSGSPSARLHRALAADPDSVTLQVGAATLLPSGPDAQHPSDGSVGTRKPENAVVVQRLQVLADRFPSDAAIRAHQLRYLVQSAVHIRRPEEGEVIGALMNCPSPTLDPAGNPSGTRTREALQAFTAAAAAGEELEPNHSTLYSHFSFSWGGGSEG